jgi:hypothetical protein
VVVHQTMNAAIAVVTTHPVLTVLVYQMVVLQMKVVAAAKLALQAVITPVVQLLLMMNAAYVVVTTHPVLTVLARQMVMLL